MNELIHSPSTCVQPVLPPENPIKTNDRQDCLTSEKVDSKSTTKVEIETPLNQKGHEIAMEIFNSTVNPSISAPTCEKHESVKEATQSTKNVSIALPVVSDSQTAPETETASFKIVQDQNRVQKLPNCVKDPNDNLKSLAGTNPEPTESVNRQDHLTLEKIDSKSTTKGEIGSSMNHKGREIAMKIFNSTVNASKSVPTCENHEIVKEVTQSTKNVSIALAVVSDSQKAPETETASLKMVQDQNGVQKLPKFEMDPNDNLKTLADRNHEPSGSVNSDDKKCANTAVKRRKRQKPAKKKRATNESKEPEKQSSGFLGSLKSSLIGSKISNFLF